MSPADQLAQALREIPSQVFADLTLGVPLVLFAVLVLLSVSARRRHRSRW